MSLSEAVVALKDRIAVHGSKGVNFHKALSDLKIDLKLGHFIAKRFLLKDGYTFSVNNAIIDISAVNEYSPQFLRVCCVAVAQDQWSSWGIQSIAELPQSNTPVAALLELIARSGSKGCVPADTVQELKTTKVHVHVDKIVNMGRVVKSLIYPSGNGAHRVKQRSTILHLKRFVAMYDPAVDGVRYETNDNLKEQIFNLIYDVLKENNLNIVPLRDLAKYLGMSKRSMQYIRIQGIALARKQECKVRFFEAVCNPTNMRGEGVSASILAWCVARNDLDDFHPAALSVFDTSVQPDRSQFNTSRNLSLWAHVDASLRTRPTGLSSNDVGHITGSSNKFAYRITSLFVHSFHYPVQKLQDGKLMRYMLFPRGSHPAPLRNITPGPGLYSKPLPTAEVVNLSSDEPSGFQMTKRQRVEVSHSPPNVAVTMLDNAVPADETDPQLKIHGNATKVLNRRVISSLSSETAMLSDLQIHRAEVLLTFLVQVSKFAALPY